MRSRSARQGRPAVRKTDRHQRAGSATRLRTTTGLRQLRAEQQTATRVSAAMVRTMWPSPAPAMLLEGAAVTEACRWSRDGRRSTQVEHVATKSSLSVKP